MNRVPFDSLTPEQQGYAFSAYTRDSGDDCTLREFIDAVANWIDWDARSAHPWGFQSLRQS